MHKVVKMLGQGNLGLILAILLVCDVQAEDYKVPTGYEVTQLGLNAGAGFDYLPDGDVLAFSVDYVNGPKLLRYDVNGDGIPATPQTLLSFDSFTYGSFVAVSPDGTNALIGTTGTSNLILRVNLDDYSTSEVTDLFGNFDLVFLDNDGVYLSANSGFFDPSVPSYVYRLELSDPLNLAPFLEQLQTDQYNELQPEDCLVVN